jgi:hypothetical protein
MSLSSFAYALGYGIAILVSFVGWGALLGRVLFPKSRSDWGQQAAWGLALVIAVGGFLELTGSISSSSISWMLSAGWLAAAIKLVAFLWRNLAARAGRRPQPREALPPHPRWRKIGLTAAWAVLIAMFLVQYAGWAAIGKFNDHDDFQGYFVYPNKMLQLGSMGPDPYSERRLMSSLGGQSFLLAIVRSELEEQNFHLIDPGVSLLILAGLVWGEFRQGGYPRWALLLLLFPVAFMSPPVVNVTGLVVASVLFLSLFRSLAWGALEEHSPVSAALIVGLLTSAICTIKSTFIPVVGLVLLVSYGARVLKGPLRRKGALESVMATAVTVGLLLPWMISMYRSSGTPLFPLLGKGYHGSQYGGYVMPWGALTWRTVPEVLLYRFVANPFAVSVAALWAVLLILSRRQRAASAGSGGGPSAGHSLPANRGRRTKERGSVTPNAEAFPRRPVLSAAIAAILGTLAVSLSLGGNDVDRFVYAFLFAATLWLLMGVLRMCRQAGGNAAPPILGLGTVLIVVVALVGTASAYPRGCMERAWQTGVALVKGELPKLRLPAPIDEYRHVQESVPPGEKILARLERPYHLDFRRNPVYIVDYPGSASPPPGMPFYRGPEALAEYLAGQSIRYVAYSYSTECAFQRQFHRKRLLPTADPWARCQAEHTFDFQDNLADLMKTRRVLYDDSDIVVIDLSLRR